MRKRLSCQICLRWVTWVVGILCSNCLLLQIFLGERAFQSKGEGSGQMGNRDGNLHGQLHSLPQTFRVQYILYSCRTWCVNLISWPEDSRGHQSPDWESTTQSPKVSNSGVTNTLANHLSPQHWRYCGGSCLLAWEQRGRIGCRSLASLTHNASLLRWCPWGMQIQIWPGDYSLPILGENKVIVSYSSGDVKMSRLTSLWLSFHHGLKAAVSAPTITYTFKSQGRKNKRDHDYLLY